MQEKRKSVRHPVKIQLSISDLFTQDTAGIHGLESPIEVEDISSGGLCFVSECVLPTDYYFSAKLNLEDEKTPEIFTTVKILRAEVVDRDHYRYGCQFQNLAQDISDIIDRYSYRREE